MDALVHQAAAVLRPGAPPGRLGIIGPVPVPAHMDRPVGQPAETPRLQRPAGFLHRYIKAVLVAGADRNALLPASPDDLLRVLHGHGHGLFDDDGNMAVYAVQGNPGVKAALGGNRHQFRLRLRQHGQIVPIASDGGIARQAACFQQGLHRLRPHVAYGGYLQAVLQRGPYVVCGNAPAANQRVFHFELPSFMRETGGPLPQFFPRRAHPRRAGTQGQTAPERPAFPGYPLSPASPAGYSGSTSSRARKHNRRL